MIPEPWDSCHTWVDVDQSGLVLQYLECFGVVEKMIDSGVGVVGVTDVHRGISEVLEYVLIEGRRPQ